ncbi:MAG TPA: hypothetical protein DCY89_03950 [Gammaproteobacteria bacterium]|nr:hypothetical protein [Gammaproteobacteria bacterium]
MQRRFVNRSSNWTFRVGKRGRFGFALACFVCGPAALAAEPYLPLCPNPETTTFACPLVGGGGLQLCFPARPGSTKSISTEALAAVPEAQDAADGSASAPRAVLRVLGLDGSVQETFGEAHPAEQVFRANFLTTGALQLAHLRFAADEVELVLIVGEDQTQGMAGLARATSPGQYSWRMCDEQWLSHLDHRFFAEARIPADPRAAPLP